MLENLNPNLRLDYHTDMQILHNRYLDQIMKDQDQQLSFQLQLIKNQSKIDNHSYQFDHRIKNFDFYQNFQSSNTNNQTIIQYTKNDQSSQYGILNNTAKRQINFIRCLKKGKNTKLHFTSFICYDNSKKFQGNIFSQKNELHQNLQQKQLQESIIKLQESFEYVTPKKNTQIIQDDSLTLNNEILVSDFINNELEIFLKRSNYKNHEIDNTNDNLNLNDIINLNEQIKSENSQENNNQKLFFEKVFSFSNIPTSNQLNSHFFQDNNEDFRLIIYQQQKEYFQQLQNHQKALIFYLDHNAQKDQLQKSQKISSQLIQNRNPFLLSEAKKIIFNDKLNEKFEIITDDPKQIDNKVENMIKYQQFQNQITEQHSKIKKIKKIFLDDIDYLKEKEKIRQIQLKHNSIKSDLEELKENLNNLVVDLNNDLTTILN